MSGCAVSRSPVLLSQSSFAFVSRSRAPPFDQLQRVRLIDAVTAGTGCTGNIAAPMTAAAYKTSAVTCLATTGFGPRFLIGKNGRPGLVGCGAGVNQRLKKHCRSLVPELATWSAPTPWVAWRYIDGQDSASAVKVIPYITYICVYIGNES